MPMGKKSQAEIQAALSEVVEQQKNDRDAAPATEAPAKAKRGRPKKVAAPEPDTATAAPKKRGRQGQYSPDDIEGFKTAVRSGRAAGESWSDVFKAVQKMGFKSSIGYLQQLTNTNNGSKRKKRMGRPKGSKNKASVSMAVKARSHSESLSGIEAIVNRMVAERLNSKVKKAIEALKTGTAQLKSL